MAEVTKGSKNDPCAVCGSKFGEPCKLENCSEHNLNNLRLDTAESEIKVLKDGNESVKKLTTRVSLLITLMGIGTSIVIFGAIYMFTGMANFQALYADHRVLQQQQLHSLELSHTKQLTEIGNKLETSMGNKFQRMDDRLDKFGERMASLERSVDDAVDNNRTKK